MPVNCELLRSTDFSLHRGSYFHSMTNESSAEVEQSQTPAASTSGHEAIRDLAKDPASTAAAFLSGNFAKDGIGKTGTAYRRLTALETAPEEDLIEGWSDFLASLSELWEHGHKEACLAALEVSRSHFKPPHEFATRIEEHIEQAKAHIALDKIEARFEQGDDDAALNLIRGLPEDMQAEYSVFLKARARNRRKTRTIAFSVAGVMCACLAGFSVSGAISAKRLIDNPPTFALPDFTTPQIVEEFRNLREVKAEQARIEKERAEQEEVKQTNSNGATSAAVVFGDDPDPVAAQDQPQPIPDQDTRIDISPDDRQIIAEKPKVSEKRVEITPEMLYNCALGMAGAQKAADYLTHADDPVKAEKLAAFQTKLDAACKQSGVTPDQLIPIVATLDPAKIDEISQGILSN
jgi:hypothetical protein